MCRLFNSTFLLSALLSVLLFYSLLRQKRQVGGCCAPLLLPLQTWVRGAPSTVPRLPPSAPAAEAPRRLCCCKLQPLVHAHVHPRPAHHLAMQEADDRLPLYLAPSEKTMSKQERAW